MRSYWKPAVAIVVAIVLLVTGITLLAGGSLNKVSANEWGCLYGGGIEAPSLKETIKPGTSGGFTIFDKLVTIPSDDRIYAIDDDPNTADFGAQKIIVPAKGTNTDDKGIVQVTVPVQARFTINENVCDLWANYLKKYENEGLNWNGTNDPSNPGGWAKFLNLQMNQVLITAARSSISGASYVTLYTDFTKYPDYQAAISKALTSSLKSSLGGEYFCGPSYVFDGKADGKLENCPPIEITIKEIQPVDPQFLDNLKTIVANQEAQTVIKSNQEKAVAQAQADKATQLAQTQANLETSLAATEAAKDQQLAQTAADQETRLAAVAADQAIQEAQTAKDILIAQATVALVTVNVSNDKLKAEAEAAFCSQLAQISVDCAEYFKAMNWKPSIILGESNGVILNAS